MITIDHSTQLAAAEHHHNDDGEPTLRLRVSILRAADVDEALENIYAQRVTGYAIQAEDLPANQFMRMDLDPKAATWLRDQLNEILQEA